MKLDRLRSLSLVTATGAPDPRRMAPETARIVAQQAAGVPDLRWLSVEGFGVDALAPEARATTVEVLRVLQDHRPNARLRVTTDGSWVTTPMESVAVMEQAAALGVQEMVLLTDRIWGAPPPLDKPAVIRVKDVVRVAKRATVRPRLLVPVLRGPALPREWLTTFPAMQITFARRPFHRRGFHAEPSPEGPLETRPLAAFTSCPRDDAGDRDEWRVFPDGAVHVCPGVILGTLPLGGGLAGLLRRDPVDHSLLGALAAGGPAALRRLGGSTLDECPSTRDVCIACRQAREQLPPGIV